MRKDEKLKQRKRGKTKELQLFLPWTFFELCERSARCETNGKWILFAEKHGGIQFLLLLDIFIWEKVTKSNQKLTAHCEDCLAFGPHVASVAS